MTRPTTQGRIRLAAKTPDFFVSVCFAWSAILTGVTGFFRAWAYEGKRDRSDSLSHLYQ